LVLVAALATVALVSQAEASAASLPVTYNFGVGFVAEATHPGSAPPGANIWTCRPTAAHPRPVVLVHGTFGDMTDSWQALSPLLKNKGYCVFALDYGDGGQTGNPIKGSGDIPTSAAQLKAFVTTVLAATHATKVDIVGHSQGGMMPRYYLKFLGGAAKVGTLVGLVPSNHGTTLEGLGTLATAFPGGSAALGASCAACSQQIKGSAFLTKLNAGGDTIPGVNYTVISTKYDEVVTPYSSAFLVGPHVTNETVQSYCPLDAGEHLAIIYDRTALGLVANALDPAHHATPPCGATLPGVGG
jgi:triacylglycerol esterase/lipase EstA (alpha/beta hydrolase family)